MEVAMVIVGIVAFVIFQAILSEKNAEIARLASDVQVWKNHSLRLEDENETYFFLLTETMSVVKIDQGDDGELGLRLSHISNKLPDDLVLPEKLEKFLDLAIETPDPTASHTSVLYKYVNSGVKERIRKEMS